MVGRQLRQLVSSPQLFTKVTSSFPKWTHTVAPAPWPRSVGLDVTWWLGVALALLHCSWSCSMHTFMLPDVCNCWAILKGAAENRKHDKHTGPTHSEEVLCIHTFCSFAHACLCLLLCVLGWESEANVYRQNASLPDHCGHDGLYGETQSSTFIHYFKTNQKTNHSDGFSTKHGSPNI